MIRQHVTVQGEKDKEAKKKEVLAAKLKGRLGRP